MTTKSATKSVAKPKAKKKDSSDSKKTGTKTVAKSATRPAAKTSATTTSKAKSPTDKQTRKAPKNPSLSASTKKIKLNGNGSDKRVALIQQMAYFIAEKRGFEGGDPVQDWLAAERQVDEMLNEKRT